MESNGEAPWGESGNACGGGGCGPPEGASRCCGRWKCWRSMGYLHTTYFFSVEANKKCGKGNQQGILCEGRRRMCQGKDRMPHPLSWIRTIDVLGWLPSWHGTHQSTDRDMKATSRPIHKCSEDSFPLRRGNKRPSA